MRKRRTRFLALCLCALILLSTACSGRAARPETGNAGTEENVTYALDKVSCTFLEETMDVTRNVMEIPGGMAEPMKMKVDFSFGPERMIYKIRQMNGAEIIEIAESDSSEFSFMADKLTPGLPTYLTVTDGDGKILLSRELAMRVHKSLMAQRVPDSIGAEFGSGFKISMDDFVPGMALNVLPFLIPVTVKTYADGAVRVGIGYNSSDQEFWEKAASGQMPEKELGEKLKSLYEKDYQKTNQKAKPEGMGLVVLFSGWAEGNVNSLDPVKGHMQLYIGSGVDITGQYLLFTWEVMMTAGAEGTFDFSFNFKEEDSQYHFSADEIRLGLKWGVELYGGIGCTLASVGAYGAATLQYQEEMYPNPTAEHLILAGEVGLKAKLFGKVIASFTIISGSHDFLEKSTLADGLGTALSAEQLREYFYANDYADTVGVAVDDTGQVRWFGSGAENAELSDEWTDVRDFSHLLASNIYSDNQVQIANVGGRALPMMDMIFLGNDASRAAGNRSRLMTAYYDLANGFIADPVPVADDGTADFDPYLYNDSAGPAYLVWKNAVEPLTADMTFAQIAGRTDIVFSEYQTGNSWYAPTRVTNLAGSGRFAALARVCTGKDGSPVIVYYTNSVDDPMGLGGEHEIFLARFKSGEWVSEKLTEITGAVTAVDVAPFGMYDTVAVSYEQDGKAVSELWQNGRKAWERSGASSARFVSEGSGSMRAVWYENGRVWGRDSAGNVSAVTPEDVTIPAGSYDIYGQLGSGPVMIVSTSLKDTSGNVFAYYSANGGITWGKADLTHVEKNAAVSHVCAAFTNEKEPILVYSVQEYRVNADLDRMLEDPASYQGSGQAPGSLQLGDDGRFTELQSDLYIKARLLNRHAALEAGTALDTDSARPGQPLTFDLTIRNTGLYNVDHAVILCEGRKVGELTQTIKPGETAVAQATVTVPDRPGTELSYRFEVSTRDDQEPESSLTVAVDPGHLEVAGTTHTFVLGRESIAYKIKNYGYSEKPFRLVVRDDARDVTLFEKTDTVMSGGTYTGSYDARQDLFVREGCENVTMYILFGDEQPGDPDISVNRTFSIVPLEEIYGQSMDPLE